MPPLRISIPCYAETLESIQAEIPALEARLPDRLQPVGFIAGAKSPIPVQDAEKAAVDDKRFMLGQLSESHGSVEGPQLSLSQLGCLYISCPTFGRPRGTSARRGERSRGSARPTG